MVLFVRLGHSHHPLGEVRNLAIAGVERWCLDDLLASTKKSPYCKCNNLIQVVSLGYEVGAISENDSYVAMQALNAIDALGEKAAPLKSQLATLPALDPKSPARVNQQYTTALIKRLIEVL